MADPLLVDCPKDVFTKVATDVTSGLVHKISTDPNKYLQTYRMTGGTAPTEKDEAVPMFIGTDTEQISSSAGIDVYVWPIGKDGLVRVDL